MTADTETAVRWILVTGASARLMSEEKKAARDVGYMLAREGYGLIIGDWPGVDQLVQQTFLEVVPESEQAGRIKHVRNHRASKPRYVRHAQVLQDDGADPGYSLSAIKAANAGIVISGRMGSKPSMDALIRHRKPVLPLPFLGRDAFEVYCDILDEGDVYPVPGLTERQYLELMKSRGYADNLARLLKAALATHAEIFVSYRRADVPAAAGRLFDEMAHTYGENVVFIDYTNLDHGEPLGNIYKDLAQCKVVLAVIGQNWETQRLHEKEDYVRGELEKAHQNALTVIPLLVNRQVPPLKEELPESIQFICDLKCPSLNTDAWEYGMIGLKKAINKALFA